MKPGLNMGGDLTQAFAALGAITGITQAVESSEYQTNMIKFMHGKMVEEFDKQLHLKAGAMRERFHHVYEWGMLGMPEGALWRNVLSGTGATRTAGFEFMASKRPIPTPEERAQNPDDPMSEVDPEERAKLSKRRYIFHWKAPLMEYRMNVTIAPKNGRFIFITTWERPSRFLLYPRAANQESGNEFTAGAFTSEWVDFFGGRGQEIGGEAVRNTADEDFQRASQQWPKTIRSRRMNLTIQTASDNQAAFEAGRRDTANFLARRAARRDESYGD